MRAPRHTVYGLARRPLHECRQPQRTGGTESEQVRALSPDLCDCWCPSEFEIEHAFPTRTYVSVRTKKSQSEAELRSGDFSGCPTDSRVSYASACMSPIGTRQTYHLVRHPQNHALAKLKRTRISSVQLHTRTAECRLDPDPTSTSQPPIAVALHHGEDANTPARPKLTLTGMKPQACWDRPKPTQSRSMSHASQCDPLDRSPL